MPKRLGEDELQDLHEVYRGNVSAVYAFFTYSVDAETAEDLTAATFERVVRSWRRYDDRRASVRTWVLTIARNLLTDHFRRQSHRRGPSFDEHPALAAWAGQEEDPAERCASVDAIKTWLLMLQPREREVLALRYGADLPTGEIAHCLGLSEANVHQIVSRALRRLRAILTDGELSGSVELVRGRVRSGT
ncbi:MAG TPA: sigma-70 family RNA polymerase sigma factor [Baekduia sp.]|nr:sigma-70 family RNA polymerase sigma factor [Baekduia sp.]